MKKGSEYKIYDFCALITVPVPGGRILSQLSKIIMRRGK